MTDTTRDPAGSANDATDGRNAVLQLYRQSLSLLSARLAAGSLSESLLWAQTSNLLGQLHELGEAGAVRQAYVEIILRASARAHSLGLHCGNVLGEHKDICGIILKASDHLVDTLKGGKEIPYAFALVVQGFSRQVHEQVSEFCAHRELHTPAAKLDEMLTTLERIIEHASRLDETHSPYPQGLQREAFRTALSNARLSLVRFANFLCEWDKAAVYCKHVFWLVTGKALGSEGELSAGLSDLWILASEELQKAHAHLAAHNYKESTQAIDKAARLLAA